MLQHKLFPLPKRGIFFLNNLVSYKLSFEALGGLHGLYVCVCVCVWVEIH